jgi:putative transposase
VHTICYLAHGDGHCICGARCRNVRWLRPGGPRACPGFLGMINIGGPACPGYIVHMPRLRHYDHLGTARFVTFCCYHRYQLLTDSNDIRAVLGCLDRVCRKHDIRILGYVIMPEHVHFVLHPPDEVRMGQIVGEIKSRSAREILSGWKERSDRRLSKLLKPGSEDEYRFWQPRCYDHNCRTPETVIEKIEYCHKNPVNRGLVSSIEDWRWSSYGWYHGVENVALEIDGYDS